MPTTIEKILEMFHVPPEKRVRLKDYDPAWSGPTDLPKAQRKKRAQELLSEDLVALDAAQELLYASDTYSILIILQALDAAGKDGLIKHVMSGLNPQGCQVYSFKQPSSEELDHTFLWRCMKVLPERGRIGIFNRSYYEEVLVVKVHPELVARQRIPGAKVNKDFWQGRYEDINYFEQHLARNGTVILKFFLYVSKEEQRNRLLQRAMDPKKFWKFSPGDLQERDFWDDYIAAYEDALSATSTEWAPWYIIPADHKWVSRAMVAKIIATTIQKLELRYPTATPEAMRELEEGRRQLESQK
jgi:PPK2 family polyphosphate:nucleotide phosphotransferase